MTKLINKKEEDSHWKATQITAWKFSWTPSPMVLFIFSHFFNLTHFATVSLKFNHFLRQNENMTSLSEDSSDGGNSFTMGVCLDTLSDGGVRFFQSFQFDPLCKTVTKVKPLFLTKTLQQRKNFDGASL